jgi:hypothetical protein
MPAPTSWSSCGQSRNAHSRSDCRSPPRAGADMGGPPDNRRARRCTCGLRPSSVGVSTLRSRATRGAGNRLRGQARVRSGVGEQTNALVRSGRSGDPLVARCRAHANGARVRPCICKPPSSPTALQARQRRAALLIRWSGAHVRFWSRRRAAVRSRVPLWRQRGSGAGCPHGDHCGRLRAWVARASQSSFDPAPCL